MTKYMLVFSLLFLQRYGPHLLLRDTAQETLHDLAPYLLLRDRPQ